MSARFMRSVFVSCGMAGLVGMTACGQLLDLDAYTRTNSNSGGMAGMGNGGQGGESGQGGQGGQMSECKPSETAPCYDGTAGTEVKGVCKAGTKTCGADGKFGACEGQVIPSLENCAVALDEDCNGTAADCTGTGLWSKSYGTTANLQSGNIIRAMSDGSIVVLGDFADNVDFGCEKFTSDIMTTDVFLMKLDAEGNCLFAKQFTSSGMDYGYDMDLDANDDILITGGYSGASIDFGGGPMIGHSSNDIYLARFDKNGMHLWSKHYGDSSDQLAYSVSLDKTGNIFLAGDFGGTIDFGNGIGLTVNAFGYTAGFIAKLDSSGKHIFSDSFEVDTVMMGTGVSRTKAIAETNGNVTVLGRFRGTLTVGAGGTVTSKGSAYDYFYLRYDPTGKLLAAKRFGSQGDNWEPMAATGADGSVYITGKMLGTTLDLADFGGGSITGAGGGDIFLIKLNADGTFAKAKVFGDAMDQAATGLAVDPFGYVLLSGNYKGEVDFGNGSLGTAANAAFYVAKLRPDFAPIWAKAFFSNQAQSSIRVGTDPMTNVLLTGSFAGNLLIVSGMSMTSAGSNDIFAAKLAP